MDNELASRDTWLMARQANSPSLGPLAYLSCGESFVAVLEAPAASAAMPGNCVRDAAVEVELGRDMGSITAGGGNICPSSMAAACEVECRAAQERRALGKLLCRPVDMIVMDVERPLRAGLEDSALDAAFLDRV
jgi:hypothetical protein